MAWTEEDLARILAQGHARLVGTPGPVAARVFPVPAPSATEGPSDRYRSKTERRYAETILDLGVASGILKGYWYEPCKGLWLAPKTSYTPDFLIQYADPSQPLEFHEVKGGFIRPQDWQKTKMAAAIYHCFRFLRAQWKDQRWHFVEVPKV
jgi:hypothetical protein